ncbi:hypothetical protein RFI_17849 [Reticulomyxa filosa]|uniref:Uncharacterized protein n=1 Tax=Reticulomyxa filosa TaxID=46433 RepID=X6N101_RETFI|nr:hypothetical protein RFI_17849 [Reticulomyxa filosa]|eukprot:ETO19379.1 hypothetical protein RFI_17849 [Reticulomyxa filosa]
MYKSTWFVFLFDYSFFFSPFGRLKNNVLQKVQLFALRLNFWKRYCFVPKKKHFFKFFIFKKKIVNSCSIRKQNFPKLIKTKTKKIGNCKSQHKGRYAVVGKSKCRGMGQTGNRGNEKKEGLEEIQVEQIRLVFLVMKAFPRLQSQLLENPKLILAKDFQQKAETFKHKSSAQIEMECVFKGNVAIPDEKRNTIEGMQPATGAPTPFVSDTTNELSVPGSKSSKKSKGNLISSLLVDDTRRPSAENNEVDNSEDSEMFLNHQQQKLE